MALNKTALKNGIEQLHTDMLERNQTSVSEYAERLSNLINDFVQSGDVQPGIALTAGNLTGATTGVGKIQ